MCVTFDVTVRHRSDIKSDMRERVKALGNKDKSRSDIVTDSEGYLPRLSLSDSEALKFGLPELPKERKGRARRRRRTAAPRLPRKPRPAARPLPDGHWTAVMVMDRLQEAWETLARVPAMPGPKMFGNMMPSYRYDHGDLVAQIETAELERLLKERNRIRLSASGDAIKRMDEALAWPLQHLGGQEMRHLARTVNLAAQWMARRQDFRKRCKQIGISPRAFRRRWMHALHLIARELTARRVPTR